MHHLRENLSFIFAYSPIEKSHFEKDKIHHTYHTILHNYLTSHRDNAFENLSFIFAYSPIEKSQMITNSQFLYLTYILKSYRDCRIICSLHIIIL